MTAEPLISVVIAVIDPDPYYFPQTVQSVLAQSLSDLELVVIEEPLSPGKTTPSAGELLADFDDPRIRHYLHPHRTSLVRQRNRGLHAARADLVAWIDADDVCLPDRLVAQLERFSDDPQLTVAGSQLEVIDARGERIGYRSYPSTHHHIAASLPFFNPLAQPSVMLRKQAVLQAGGYLYDRYLAVEDYELWCRLAHRGARFANCSEPLTQYRIHPGGMKTTKLRSILRGTLDIKSMYFADRRAARYRLRRLGERLLLWLPPRFVVWLFKQLTLKKQLPT